MATMRVTWTEKATYSVDIETDKTATQLEDEPSGDGEGLWFELVEQQHEDWPVKHLLEVSEREVQSIERVAGGETSDD